MPSELLQQDCSQLPAQESQLPPADEPVLGIPLSGTVVMGVPLGQSTPRKHGAKPSKAKQAKAKHPKQARNPKRPASEATEGQDEPKRPQGASQQKAKPRRKRKAEEPQSPARLAPISPGALSLQEGVKRRRLAKQAEAKAAAVAASDVSQQAGEPVICCPIHAEAAPAEAAAELPSKSQPASDCHDQQQQQHACHDAALFSEQDIEASHEPGRVAGACSAKHRRPSAEHTGQQSEAGQQLGAGQSLSFDVGAMELFQQQDTCDAFGSFWRRTSGMGAHKASGSSQPAPTALAAVGGDHQAWLLLGAVQALLPHCAVCHEVPLCWHVRCGSGSGVRGCE